MIMNEYKGDSMLEPVQNQQHTITVLTIEDEEGLRKSIVDYFEDSGFSVIEAANGSEGLEAFRAHKPDIVFTDLCMPNGHGLEIIPMLRRESPFTPVVVVSGAGMVQDAVEAMKRGAWDYVSKPVRELAVLEQLTFKMLDRARKLRERFERNRRVHQQLAEKYEYDALTGLPTRQTLNKHFTKIQGSEPTACIGLIDLDNFKAVKESFGHAASDQILRIAAARLKKLVSENDLLVRLGGDEFALLLNFATPPSTADMETVAANVRNIFSLPVSLHGKEIFITASVGLAASPTEGSTIEELLRLADIATTRAKELGQNSFQIYSSAITARTTDRFTIQTKLRRALEKEEFSLHYQPQVEVASGEIAGVEALLRWQPTEGKSFSPMEFIPALEESGLIVEVGEWVLKTACRQQREWVDSGFKPVVLSVNVSALQFRSLNFPEKLADIIAETGIRPEHLCLELTESIVMKDLEETIDTLRRLRGLGVSLSLDDFGTGYSSLSYLRKMPISELKIDRSFIATIPDDQNNAMIVSTIISMAHCLNMRVVAEGVETAEQLAYLAAHNCQMAQGYYFSRPVPADECNTVLMVQER